ncbi:MAG: hypothetical protein AAF564_12280 [Bacteroidota bacterium]
MSVFALDNQPSRPGDAGRYVHSFNPIIESIGLENRVMSNHSGPKEYLVAARSFDTSADELAELSRSEYTFVRVAVAGNLKTKPEILHLMIPDKIEIESYPSQEIALQIALNVNSSRDTLKLLGEKLLPCLKVGRGAYDAFRTGVVLCCNSLVPIQTIERMLKPENASRQFRKVVARESRREDVLYLLLIDQSEKVRKRAETTLRAIKGSKP